MNFNRLENIALALKPANQNGRNFHVTFVYFGNKLICIANNDYSREHPYHKLGRYKASRGPNRYYKAGLHSEVRALLKMGIEDCSRLTFVNLRIDNNNQTAISKPCPNCEKLIRDVGFKTFYYYDGGDYQKLN